jgi:hypothetical protein
MAKLFHSVAQQERAVAADGIEVIDLPVNPLSVVLVCIRPLNETSTLGNYARYLNLCDSLNRVTLSHRGGSIISGSGVDLASLNYLRHGMIPREANPDDTDNERRCVVLPLLLGRMAYDSESCFPASRRGELSLELDIDVADTGYDGFRYSIETIEILGATPKEFERKTTTTRTFAATGPNDIELPIGNMVRGLHLFGTTGFTGAAPAPSWGRVSVRKDGQEQIVGDSDFETIVAINSLLGRLPPSLDLHTHRVPTNAGANEETTGPIEQGMGGWELRAFLDFDPTRDDEFSLDTAGAQSFSVRAEAETADAVRVLTVERMRVSELVG